MVGEPFAPQFFRSPITNRVIGIPFSSATEVELGETGCLIYHNKLFCMVSMGWLSEWSVAV